MTVKTSLRKRGILMAALVVLPSCARAQGAPDVSPALKKMLGALPIDGIKTQVLGMVGALKKTGCANLTGCYATQSGPLQLYFFTSGKAQQTLIL